MTSVENEPVFSRTVGRMDLYRRCVDGRGGYLYFGTAANSCLTDFWQRLDGGNHISWRNCYLASERVAGQRKVVRSCNQRTKFPWYSPLVTARLAAVMIAIEVV